MVSADSDAVAFDDQVAAVVLNTLYERPDHTARIETLGAAVRDFFLPMRMNYIPDILWRILSKLCEARAVLEQSDMRYRLPTDQWLRMSRGRSPKCSKETAKLMGIRASLTKTSLRVREQLADFPTGATFDELFDAAAKFLPISGGGQVLRLVLFQLELDDRIVKEDRDGIPCFKLTPDGFLKEALREQDQNCP